jgi:hypothetical protein
MDYLINILQNHFKTNNIILDTIIVATISFIVNNYQTWFNILNIYYKDFFDRSNNIKSEYLIRGIVTTSTQSYSYQQTYFPDEYKAVMFKLNKLNIDIVKAKKFNKDNVYGRTLDASKSKFSYSINTAKEIQVTNNIFVRQINNNNKTNDLKSSIETYNLYIYSYTLNFNLLIQEIEEWKNEYNKFIKEYTDGNNYYFSYLGRNENKDNKDAIDKTLVNFESHIFKSFRRFDNIFFEKKDQLIQRLDYFINNKERYSQLGIPHTLGLLFHGKPGCGKTSAIKAIANYTDRHVVEIPLSKIKTCGELKKVFFKDIINGYYVPPDKKIIILEDIDCMSEIVKKREDKDNDKESNDSDSEENFKANYFKKYMETSIRLKDDEDKLNLSYILNIIDGVLEQPGRIHLIIQKN